MTPRASFVIPAYNAELWLSKAILSCLNQTIKQIEVIVVDDGSTDGTPEIIKHYEGTDKRVFGISLPENKGRSVARNVGNEFARAPYILVLDADDMSARNRVKDTLAAMILKKADLSFGSFYAMDSMGNADRRIVSKPFDPEVAKSEMANYICHSTMAYTKELWKVIRYDEGEYSKLGLDDWKFQWDAFKAGYKFTHIRSPLAYYRVTEGQTVATRDQDAVKKAKEAYLVA